VSCSELYVYYKLRPGQALAARTLVGKASLPASLPAGVTLRLLQRDGSDELLTWMEIYQGPSAQDLALAERLVAAALAPCIQGERHIERFAPLPLTAP
jgi:hypothetical protein